MSNMKHMLHTHYIRVARDTLVVYYCESGLLPFDTGGFI
jgi:hypothetical protein